MSVIFQAAEKYYVVSYEQLFKCGTNILALANLFHHNNDGYTDERGVFHFPTTTLDKEHFFGSEEEWETLQAQPDWKNAGRSYVFGAGEECNKLVLDDPIVIEAMRAYARNTDNRIVELDEAGNDPVENIEGTPFIADIPHYQLTPAMYKHNTSAGGKVFNFNMGSERNQYITEDADEIRLLRDYVKGNMNCGISDPTYVPPTL